jgi:oligopeptide/dipeptide ABC transporter ATP-binding protein
MVEPLLEAVKLSRSYPGRSGGRGTVTAVDGISLRVERGESLGVVGESGSGKSTLARLLLALERPDTGTVHFAGEAISELPEARVRPLRKRFQPVFQDPVASLNPRLCVATIVAEPLAAFGIGTSAGRLRRVHELLAQVGLPDDSAERHPGAFSGGERQRIAIARALAPEPELLVLDEPVSSLDVSVRAEILALLAELRRRLGLAMVLIAHDLEVVREVCDRVAVVYRGVIVEHGATEAVLSSPAHPYTGALLAAAPIADPDWRPPPPPEAGDRMWPKAACRYADRCPRADEGCTTEPELEQVNDDRELRCWRPETE